MSLSQGGEPLHMVSSPTAGTLQRTPAPGERPYAGVGDRVESGQTLCIVHTMRPAAEIPDTPTGYSGEGPVEVQYEVTADVSGEVAEVSAEDGDEVEFDQPLFSIRPEGL